MRCEGGVAPGFFRSLYAPIERASGGVTVQASSAAAVTRSRSESSSMLHSLPLLFPTGLNSRQQSPFSPFKEVHNRAKVGRLPTSGGIHPFGRFCKLGVEGQQWRMPPDCELQINRVINGQPVLTRELQGCAAVRLTIEPQGQFLQEVERCC